MGIAVAGLSIAFAQAATIPPVHGETFAGAHVDLPGSLQSKTGVLVIGFTQASRASITAWGKQLAADYYDSPTVAYYEMPVLAAVPKFMRGFVEGRIKSDVSDRGKAHFLPITSDEPAWRSAVRYSSPDVPYILIIDEQGTILWQTQGPPSVATYSLLKQKIDAARPHASM